MARKHSRAPLHAFLNGERVGRLFRRAGGLMEFVYDPTWLDQPHALPVSLSLPLREEPWRGDAVLAVFDNLLPDSPEVRRRLAARTGASGEDPWSLLAAIGRDCVGALQLLEEGVEPGLAGRISGRPLDESEIAERIRRLHEMPLGLDAGREFRISLAGAQDKTALLHSDETWLEPRGSTPTTHILKPPIGLTPGGIDLSASVENEFLCLRILGTFGLPVARAEIRAFEDLQVLVVERFDRCRTADGRLLRLPQEDCCQAMSVPPARKYNADGGPGIVEVLELLKASDDPAGDRRLFLKAQILYWLLAAIDGHAKNFSLFLYPGGRFRLAPLYDVISAAPLAAAGQLRRTQVKLAMAVGDRRHYQVDEIQPRHFMQTATRAGMPESDVETLFEEIHSEVEEALTTALTEVADDPVPREIREPVCEGIRHRASRLANWR